MLNKIKINDDSLAVRCTSCNHLGPIDAVPTDDQGRVHWRFEYRCPNCGKSQETQLSDIQSCQAYKH